MKEKICVAIIGICMLLIIGLFGGVDNGEPVTNLVWCVPLLAVIVVCNLFLERG